MTGSEIEAQPVPPQELGPLEIDPVFRPVGLALFGRSYSKVVAASRGHDP
jgi:hypothetical protein